MAHLQAYVPIQFGAPASATAPAPVPGPGGLYLKSFGCDSLPCYKLRYMVQTLDSQNSLINPVYRKHVLALILEQLL